MSATTLFFISAIEAGCHLCEAACGLRQLLIWYDREIYSKIYEKFVSYGHVFHVLVLGLRLKASVYFLASVF